MNIKNVSEERKQMIIQAARNMEERMKAASVNQKQKTESSQSDLNETYIIELFTITENQTAEIQHLKNTITEQQMLINHLMEKLKVIDEVMRTDVSQKVEIRKVDIVEEVIH